MAALNRNEMSERPYTGAGNGTVKEQIIRRSGASPEPTRMATPRELRLAVVRYDEGPDRCTLYPPGLTGIERMETWISADMSAVVDLLAWQ